MEHQPTPGIGALYHRETMYLGRAEAAVEPPQLAPGTPIDLPSGSPERLSGPLGRLLAERRSRRDQGASMSLTTLADLLWATQGVTRRVGRFLLRTAPSAGALHPLDSYVICGDLEGLAAGIYRLDVGAFQLVPLAAGDFRPALAAACLGQKFVAQAPASLIWAAVPERCTVKYGERGWRYIYMDAGHLAQNLYLAAEGLGLACCTVGALFDDVLNDLLGLDGIQASAIYLGSVGPGGRE